MRPLNIFTATALVSALAFSLWADIARSEITGPDAAQAGQIAVFVSDSEAAWAVIPETYAPAMYVDTSQRSLVFASPEAGVVTVVAATVTDGAPTISVKTFYNGVEPGPNPTPNPTPAPAPDPTTLEGVAKAAADKIVSDKSDQERLAIAESLQTVVDGIQRGTIRTASGARATLRQVWLARAVKISSASAKNWQPFFDAISPLVEPTDVAQLKADFTTVVEAIKPTVQRLPPCTDGQCPTGGLK